MSEGQQKEGPQPGPEAVDFCAVKERMLQTLAAQSATIYQMTELVSVLHDEIKAKLRRIDSLQYEAAKTKHVVDKLLEKNKLLEQQLATKGQT